MNKIPIRFPKGIQPRESEDKPVGKKGKGLQDEGFESALRERIPDFEPSKAPPDKAKPKGLLDTASLLEQLEKEGFERRDLERKRKAASFEELKDDEGLRELLEKRYAELPLSKIIKLKMRIHYKRILVMFAVFIIVLTPLFVTYLEEPTEPVSKINLDGKFDDWKPIYKYKDSLSEETVGSDLSLDIAQTAVTEENGNIYVYVEVSDDMILRGFVDNSPDKSKNNLADGLFVFIDVNPKLDRGYSVFGTHADFMVEIYGFGGFPYYAALKKFNERYRTDGIRENTDWNAWELHAWLPVRASDKSLELGLRLGITEPTPVGDYQFVIMTQNHKGKFDCLDRIISMEQPSLSVRRNENSVDIISSDDLSSGNDRAWIFSLEFLSINGPSELNLIKFNKLGDLDDSAVQSIMLFDDTDHDGRFSPSDILIQNSVYGFVQGENQMSLPAGTLTFEDEIVKLVHVVAAFKLAAGNIDGTTFGIALKDNSFGTESVVTYKKDTLIGDKLHYMITEPVTIVIDGIFTDWKGAGGPALIQDSDQTVITNQNVDLKTYGHLLTSPELALFMSVDGKIFEGTPLPIFIHYFYPSLVEPREYFDLDGDGRLDFNGDGTEEQYNTKDDDFDNDGWPDEVDPDIDGDLVNNDLDLEPRNPYIGDVYPQVIERLGQDIVRTYIDLDGNTATGYNLEGISHPTGAELFIEIRGRDHKIHETAVYRYNPSYVANDELPWQKDNVMTADLLTAKDLKNLEAGLDLTPVINQLDTGGNINVYFVIMNWNAEDLDHSINIISTRGTSEPQNMQGMSIGYNSGNEYFVKWFYSPAEEEPTSFYMMITTIFVTSVVVFLWKMGYFRSW
jgi:hypothetical protein